MALHNFTYNGTSTEAMHMYIGNKSGLDMPRRSVEKISIPGRNGDIIIDNGKYENIDITYHALIDSRTYASQAEHLRAIKAWLGEGIEYQRLEDTYDTEVYRMAAMVNMVNIKRLDDRFAECDITFDCKPMRYRKSDDEEIL